MRFNRLLLCIGLCLGLPLIAHAVTIPSLSVVPTVEGGVTTYDAASVRVAFDSALTGSAATAYPVPVFGSVAGLAAAKTRLYRAVKPGELADIQKTGQLINRGSAEGKYFTSSAEDAAAYAKKAVAGFKDPPYTIIKAEVPTASLPKPVSVDGRIPAYVIPNEALPGLTPQVMPTMPIPGVR